MELSQIASELKGYSDTPELDARFFCEGKNPTNEEILSFIQRRKKGEPVSKIIGEKGFWKGIFKTNSDVLDPRPDSETLIEVVLDYYKDMSEPVNILDVGTGSGCLLASLLMEYKKATGVGIDISQKALKIAQENLKSLNSSLLQKDFMSANWTQDLGKFDIIISNPPYIRTADIETLDTEVKNYDPILALDGGLDGLYAYKQLAKTLEQLVKKEGKVFFEIGQDQETDVISIMQKNGWVFCSQHKDLGGIVRILVFGRE